MAAKTCSTDIPSSSRAVMRAVVVMRRAPGSTASARTLVVG